MEAGDLFGDESAGVELSAVTHRARKYAYGAFLGFLNLEFPERLASPPTARVDRDLIANYATYLRLTCRDTTVAIELERLYLVLVAFGGKDLTWLRKIQRRVARNAKRLVHPPITSDELSQLGFDLMDRAVAESDANGTILDGQAKLYRDGLMIALLAAIPLRRRSLAAMRIGRHLLKIGTQWKVEIPEEDSKTGVALEYAIGPSLSVRIDCYLERFRPAMPGADRHDGVWASKLGTAMVGNTILQSVTRRTVERFGHAVSPHRFRHAAASFWSVADPEGVRGAKDLLGHRTFRMTEKHYIQAQTRLAGRVLATVIAARTRIDQSRSFTDVD
jgi:integrase